MSKLINQLKMLREVYPHNENILKIYGLACEQKEKVAEIKKNYEELRIAALTAVCIISGGQAKADLRDAYDKATEYLEAQNNENI
jgi:hypothetical protein